GVGERAHMPAASVTLQTHVDDILAVVAAEEIERPILVGHSYGGLPMTGAADRLTNVAHLVYVDAVVPLPGECWSSAQPEATRTARRAAIERSGVIAAPDPAAFGLSGGDHAWVARRQTPQPGRVYDAPLEFDAARWGALPRTFVDCTRPALETIAPMRHRVRSQPGWTVHELATGHDAMVSAPEALVRILLALA
ncbi:MAG: alpha/beta hydrolase, partial [Burkholderiaceae bacterium]